MEDNFILSPPLDVSPVRELPLVLNWSVELERRVPLTPGNRGP